MVDRQEKLLQELEVRMRQLMYLCDSLQEHNTQLKEDLADKNKEIAKLSSDLADMQEKYLNLKITKSLDSGTDEYRKEARAKLSKLVQDVDKCIALLKL